MPLSQNKGKNRSCFMEFSRTRFVCKLERETNFHMRFCLLMKPVLRLRLHSMQSTVLFSCRFKCPWSPRRQQHFHINADRLYNTMHFASKVVCPLLTLHKKKRYATLLRSAYRLFLLSSSPAVSVEQKSTWYGCGIFNFGKLRFLGSISFGG